MGGRVMYAGAVFGFMSLILQAGSLVSHRL